MFFSLSRMLDVLHRHVVRMAGLTSGTSHVALAVASVFMNVWISAPVRGKISINNMFGVLQVHHVVLASVSYIVLQVHNDISWGKCT